MTAKYNFKILRKIYQIYRRQQPIWNRKHFFGNRLHLPIAPTSLLCGAKYFLKITNSRRLTESIYISFSADQKKSLIKHQAPTKTLIQLLQGIHIFHTAGKFFFLCAYRYFIFRNVIFHDMAGKYFVSPAHLYLLPLW